jgi:hypothetical protein
MVAKDGLPMPGDHRAERARIHGNRETTSSPFDGFDPYGNNRRDSKKDLTNEDPGHQSTLEAALPWSERVEKVVNDSVYTGKVLNKKVTVMERTPVSDPKEAGKPRTRDITLHTAQGTVTHRYEETATGTNDWKLSGVLPVTEPSSGSGKAGPYTALPGLQPAVPSPTVPSPSVPPPGSTVAPPVTPVAPATVAVPPSDPKANPKPVPVASPAKESEVVEEAKKKREEPSFDPPPEPAKRIVIRSGNMEFEVPSFDAATAAITKSVTSLKGAFVATVNSEKLPNGKVRGSITVRTPPEHLDGLVLELRKELGKDGELKGVNISSQDVTKQYTDLESRLRGARTMETRLLQIIKEGKGEIKQLLEAERELGVWRTKIEETEGELRYYANLAALSTLTITLAEKEIRAAATVTENERVQAGVEVDDVDKVYQQLMAAVIEAKGRITKSEVKQLAAGQFNATLNFDVPPDAAGPIRDRIKQLGRVARLEIDRVQRPEGGTLPTDAKLTRGDTVFLVQLYNLANIAARESVTLQIAVSEVPAAFQTLREVVGKTTSRVFTAKFDEQDKQNITAQLDFEVRRTDEGTVRTALAAAGETFSRQLTRAPESDHVTDSKVLYRITIISMGRLRPRETATLSVAVVDVPAAYQSLREAIAKAHGRMLNAQINEQDKQNVTAILDIDMQRSDEPAIRAAFDTAGEVLSRQITRAGESENVTDSKVRYTVSLVPAKSLKSREVTTLGIEVEHVDETATLFAAQVAEVNGRQIDAKFTREANGKSVAKLIFEVPLAAAAGLVERFKAAGTVRASQSLRDPQAPEGKFATARIEVTLANRESIIAADDGVWSQVRRGLSYSATVLLTSVTWVVFGLCVILPWAVIGYVLYRVIRRTVAPAVAKTPETVPSPPATT